MSTNKPTRRQFGAAAAATGLLFVKPEQVRGSQANSSVTIGLVGCGNRGMYVSGLFAQNELARVAGYTDIYEDKFAAAAAKYSGAKRFEALQGY